MVVVLVCFTLYGIDGIARQLEDPFGRDRNDINVDDLVEDVRVEVEGLVGEWRRVVVLGGRDGGGGGEMFACGSGTRLGGGGGGGGARKAGFGLGPEGRGRGRGVEINGR